MALLSNEIFRSNPSPIEPTFYREITDGSRRPYAIPTFYSANYTYNNWQRNTTSDAWTTADARTSSQAAAESMLWNALGGHSRGQGYANSLNEAEPILQWAKHDVADIFRWNYQYNYSSASSETVRMSRVIFLRNFHPTSAQSITWYSGGTSTWSNGSGGSGASILTPNASNYAGTTGMSHTNLWSYAGSTSDNNSSYSFSIPAQRTVALIMGNSYYYYTNSSSHFVYMTHNYTYNLQAWNNNWIQPDIRLTLAAQTFNGSGWSSNTSQYQSHNIWQWAALQYGDR